jgi:D-glucuronyl C5-epimerase-like protein
MFLHVRTAVVATALACALALIAAASAGASTVYRYEGGGRVVTRNDPTLPSRAATEPPPAGLALPACPAPGCPPRLHAALSGVKRAIALARSRHQITAAQAKRYSAAFSKARHARAALSGTARSELSDVLSTLEDIADARHLTASRMPALFLQLRRNTELWGAGVSLPYGARVTFPHSYLVFEHYSGQGLQIQPLASFGKANGLWQACTSGSRDCSRTGLRKLLDELVAIQSTRSGFPTWEYWFHFGGGSPPWTSGMADATGIQALARGSTYLHVKSYMTLARSALRVFDGRAPKGVRVHGLAPDSAHYLLYSFDAGQFVLNAFAQSLNGLYDFYLLSGGNEHALRLFNEGDRSMRREMPRYDTGSWTRYSLGGPLASPDYQGLTVDVLTHLCARSHIDFYCRYAKRFRGYLKSRTGG